MSDKRIDAIIERINGIQSALYCVVLGLVADNPVALKRIIDALQIDEKEHRKRNEHEERIAALVGLREGLEELADVIRTESGGDD
jgi:hypothetical protein